MEICRVAQVSSNWVDLIYIQKAAIYKQRKKHKKLEKMYGSKSVVLKSPFCKLSVVSLVRL